MRNTRIPSESLPVPRFVSHWERSRRRRVMACALLIAALAWLLPSAATGGSEPSSGQNVTIEDFAWLAGSWIGEGLGGTVEEIWSPPRAGQMMGSFRLIQGGKVTFMEFVTLSEHDGEIQMRLKHFHPDLVAWEDKEDFVTFRLKALTEDKAEFGGLVIHRIDADHLQIDVSLRNGDEVNVATFRFERYAL